MTERASEQTQGDAAPVSPAPGSVGFEGGRVLATSGGESRARAAFSLTLAALVLLASLAAWQGFIHSPWGARLHALNQIVFVGGASDRTLNTSSDASSWPQLYTVQPDGSGLRQLTTSTNTSYFSPVWSPDGAQIAVFAVITGQELFAHLMVMNADGSHAHIIPAVRLRLDVFDQASGANLSVLSKLIAWSPDSRQLVAPVGVARYMLVHADGTSPHPFDAIRPVWSPDGAYLAYYAPAQEDQSAPDPAGRSYKLELMDTRTFQTRLLSGLPALNGEVLAWSPDGRYLAASAFQDGSFRGEPIDSIMLVRPAGDSLRVSIRWNGAHVQEIAWSPDSQKLAVVLQPFTDGQSNGANSSGLDLSVFTFGDQPIRDIGPSDAGQPSWSPDGKHLVYGSPTDPVLLVADLSTPSTTRASVHTLAARLAYLYGPCWSPLAGVL